MTKYSKVLYSQAMEEFYSIKQIAKVLGLKTITIRRWVAKGDLKAFLLGKEYRIKKTDLDRFLEERKVKK